MKKIMILSKTGRERRVMGYEAPVYDNKILYKALPDGNYYVLVKWGSRAAWEKHGVIPQKTEIVINSMGNRAKAMIKEDLGIINNVNWKKIGI